MLKINEGVRSNIDTIRAKIKNLVNRMEARIKPLISCMASNGARGRTLSIVKNENQFEVTKSKID